MRMVPSVTQAFILGAGFGSRLRPLTQLRPKPLVPVFQEPLIVHIMRRLRQVGIRTFFINTHHLHAVWEEVFPTHQWEDCTIHFVYEPTLLDSGGGLKNLSKFLDPELPLLIHNGDILSTVSIDKLIGIYQASGLPVMLGLRNNGYLKNTGFDAQRGLVTDMRYLLGIAPGTYQFTGIYCIQPSKLLRHIPSSQTISIIPALIELIQRHQVGGYIMDEGSWTSLETPEAYLRIHLAPQDFLPKSAILRISPLACIGNNVALDDTCVIGAYASIGNNSRLDSCIVWPNVKIPEGTHAQSTLFLPQNLVCHL